jgi:HAD superfamily hydrolase (TIGR01450 family)
MTSRSTNSRTSTPAAQQSRLAPRDIASRLAKIKHFVLDLDGTIYLGNTLFDASLPFLATLAEHGIGYTFVTNNSARSRAAYATHLREMGIIAPPEAIVTSAHATMHHIRQSLPEVRRLFVLTSQTALEDYRLCGFELVDEAPDAVVVSFDTAMTYERLCATAYWISRGLPYFATHPDRVCPTDRATVLPDCGAICALLESATGRKPDAVLGKPHPAMLAEVMAKHALGASETAMIGDRLYTDIRMAREAGVLAILTLTGEASSADAAACGATLQPDLIVGSLDDLSIELVAARATSLVADESKLDAT